jgi:hypothetical protein
VTQNDLDYLRHSDSAIILYVVNYSIIKESAEAGLPFARRELDG